jgi:2-polyprenyl-6-hydroxyphenyl methylase/3-demethylubiquinone-9 3-methyltransferase
MVESVDEYLRRFEPLASLDRSVLLAEMDAVWDSIGLSNRIPLSGQLEKVAQFYSHPVWVLNGLFSERDATSRQHRADIGRYVATLRAAKVADYGGGSGVLAKIIAEASVATAVDIVEPYPFAYFLDRMRNVDRVRFVDDFDGEYDVVIAQDVLEHVDAPIEVALKMVRATRLGGTVIFANSFWPEIKCHLPSTFYLRHQFGLVMRAAGLRPAPPIEGVHHCEAFVKVTPAEEAAAKRADAWAKRTGSLVNSGRGLTARLRQVISANAAG